ERLALAPWHFSLLRKAINLVPVSLEHFDRCSTEHVESRRRRYSSDPIVDLRRFAGVLSARSVEAKREILSSEEFCSAASGDHDDLVIPFRKADRLHSGSLVPNT